MIKIVIRIVLFIAFIYLVVAGRDVADLPHLGMMLLGLIGLVGLLWEYNYKYSK